MFTSKLISSMNLLITRPTQRRLIGAAQHVRLRNLTNITLNLHHFFSTPTYEEAKDLEVAKMGLCSK